MFPFFSPGIPGFVDFATFATLAMAPEEIPWWPLRSVAKCPQCHVVPDAWRKTAHLSMIYIDLP